MKKSSLSVCKSASKKNLAVGTSVGKSDVSDNRRAVSKMHQRFGQIIVFPVVRSLIIPWRKA